MNIEEIREYCLQKKGVSESFPFDNDTLVFKVMGKMFLLTSINEPGNINVKCDPEQAVTLREQYDGVMPGYHMNKTHWNTVDMGMINNSKLVKTWIDHSYTIVVGSLPKKVREELSQM